MNRKEIFEKVKAHLLIQNAKSFTRSGGCAYRDGKGFKCAIGALIIDECYTPELEGRSVRALVVLEALECSGIADPDLWFFRGLQVIHDDLSVEEWPKALDDFAKVYNL